MIKITPILVKTFEICKFLLPKQNNSI